MTVIGMGGMVGYAIGFLFGFPIGVLAGIFFTDYAQRFAAWLVYGAPRRRGPHE